MRIDFTIGVYRAKEKESGTERWTSLIPAEHAADVSGQGEAKLRERLLDHLRNLLRRVAPSEQAQFQLPLGTELLRVPVDLKLDDGRVHGTAPLIVEPRWTGADRQRYLVYHPLRRDEWFSVDARGDVAELATSFFRHYWKRLGEREVSTLLSNGRDRLIQLAFQAEPRSLLDELPSRKKDPRVRASAPRLERVLHQLAIDETQKATGDSARPIVPRSPYRERLAYLLGGARPRSVAVIGPPGSGKTSLIQRWIADRLAEDGYHLHKNLDRVIHVWRLTGKRLIAGMSNLGEWEERCLSVLHEARKHRAVLWFEDLHLFGRLGQSRQSERSFADFFRGPVRRGDLAIVAELTPEQHARLERDAPGLAEALAMVAVPAAPPSETAQLLLHEVRALELRLPIALHPFVPRTALELGAALFPWRARPGVAIEIVRPGRRARGRRRRQARGRSGRRARLPRPHDRAVAEADLARRAARRGRGRGRVRAARDRPARRDARGRRRDPEGARRARRSEPADPRDAVHRPDGHRQDRARQRDRRVPLRRRRAAAPRRHGRAVGPRRGGPPDRRPVELRRAAHVAGPRAAVLRPSCSTRSRRRTRRRSTSCSSCSTRAGSPTRPATSRASRARS